jgi:competence protein ComEC
MKNLVIKRGFLIFQKGKIMFLKRPIIVIFVIYSFILIAADYAGVFLPKNQSFLYHLAQYNRNVKIEGKIISEPEQYRDMHRFILKAAKVSETKIDEKILVYLNKNYEVSYGDNISIEGKISIPQKAAFPLIFDYQQYLARDEIYTVIYAKGFEFISSSPNPIMKFALSIRRDFVKKTDKYFKKSLADILKPIVIGDKSSLERETKDLFIDAGLMHILVVSGMNVAFVGALFIVIFKLFGLSLRKAFICSIPFIFLYVLATGANPPVLRAGIMFSCLLISLSLDREPLIYNSLALSALLILILTPQQLFTASFQMSYLATLGIVYFYNKIYFYFKNIKQPVLKLLSETFCVTLSAQIPMIPIGAYYFGKISLISFAANMTVVPMIGITTTLGFIFYFFTFISSFISLLISYVLSALLYIILFATIFFGQVKYASILVAKPHIWQIAAFFVFFFSLSFFKGKKKIVICAIILILYLGYCKAVKMSQKGKVYETFYEGRNMSVLHIKTDDKNTFIINQKNKYDRYYIYSLGEYMRLAGIKNAEIIYDGSDREELYKDLGLSG